MKSNAILKKNTISIESEMRNEQPTGDSSRTRSGSSTSPFRNGNRPSNISLLRRAKASDSRGRKSAKRTLRPFESSVEEPSGRYDCAGRRRQGG